MRIFIINLKQYLEPIDRRDDLKDAILDIESEAMKKNVRLIVAPQFLESNFYVWNKCYTYLQHTDFYDKGKGTGFVLAETLIKNGVKGTLLNHSEHRLKYNIILKTIERLKKLNLEVCLCAKNSREVKKFSNLDVDYIAIEPPKLIGGDISISVAKPDLITKSVKNAGNKKLLVGAGIKNADDVKRAIELGASGILVASGIAKASNFKEAILNLLKGF